MVRKGRLSDAAQCYSEALRLAPDERYFNALAWLLATAPDPALRDGKRAVALASRLCELTRFQTPRPLDILGASYAEAGMFPEALRAATTAIACAQKQGNARLAAEIEARLSLYRQGKAFHQ
jgi:tetratricopeptide (TPR) repeat protein